MGSWHQSGLILTGKSFQKVRKVEGRQQICTQIRTDGKRAVLHNIFPGRSASPKREDDTVKQYDPPMHYYSNHVNGVC